MKDHSKFLRTLHSRFEKRGFGKRESWHSRWLAPLFRKDCSISNLKDSRSKVLSFGARKKLVSQRINDLIEIIRILRLNLKILLGLDFQDISLSQLGNLVFQWVQSINYPNQKILTFFSKQNVGDCLSLKDFC